MNNINLFLLIISVSALSSAYEYGHHEHHEPAPFQFEYGVNDTHTGDFKEAKEFSDGQGGVKGYYKLKEADGTHRIVHYTAGKHQGFIAHVDKIGHAHHPAVYHQEPYHHQYHHDTHSSWANQPHHRDSKAWDSLLSIYDGAHYPYHYQPVLPVHKFDLHHDKHHGSSHQYVSLHHK